MALKFPNGAVFGIATIYAAAIEATAGSALEMAVAGAETGGALPLKGIDTTDATLYPTGDGDGGLVKASDFVNFSQQGDLSSSGGDQQFWTGQFLEDKSGRQIQVPTYKNAKSYTLPLSYDPKLPWYAALKQADAKREPVVIRCTLPTGDTLYYYGYVSFDGDPSMSANNPMQNTVVFTSLSDPTLIEAP